MMEPDFRPEFGIGAFEYEGPGSFGKQKLVGTKLDVLQREVTWKLEERKKQMEGYMQRHGISIDEEAIHNRVEKIRGLDMETLDALEKEVNVKLMEKKKEMERLFKSR